MPRIIRASEIGSYLYCHKAWKFERQKVKSENQAALEAGTRLHYAHGRKVIATGVSRGAALIFLVAAVVAFVLQMLSVG